MQYPCIPTFPIFLPVDTLWAGAGECCDQAVPAQGPRQPSFSYLDHLPQLARTGHPLGKLGPLAGEHLQVGDGLVGDQ